MRLDATGEQDLVVADCVISPDMKHVIVVPRRLSQRLALRSLIRSVTPQAKLTSVQGGTGLNIYEASLLKDSQVEGLDLRWSDDAIQLLSSTQHIEKVHKDVFEKVLLAKQGVDYASQMLSGIDTDLLDAHQIVNVAAMTVPDGFGLCLFDEQGAGKTVTAIYAYDVLVGRDEVDVALIVAPKSMVGEWPQDIQKFKPDLYHVEIVTGSQAQKRKILSTRADIYVTNYETVVSMEEELTALIRQYRGRTILIVDESFFIKNRDAHRTQSLRRIRKWCSRAFVLCGTPAPNSAQDLVEQFNLVDMGFTFKDRDIPEQREQALPIIRNLINTRGIYVRHLKQDVLPELPGKNFNTVLVPMEPEQSEIYKAMLDGYINELKAIDDVSFNKKRTSFLAKRSALLQICSSPALILPNYSKTPTKLLVLDNILEELIVHKNEKVVVWAFFTKSIDNIMSRYAKFNPVRYDGTVSEVSRRRTAVELFQTDPKVKLFVANAAAAGAGLTLHSARYAIYESFSDQAAHYLQSLDRIHRRGQEREVQYIALLAENTIEIDQFQMLQNKERAAQELLGDYVQNQSSRVVLLEEAINAAKRIIL